MISDLLKPERTNLVIREDKKKGVFVEGLSEWVVRSPQEIYGLMERGGLMRATGSTKMNELSSRSHAVFIIIAEQSETTYVDESGRTIEAEAFHQLLNSTKSSTELSKVCLLLHKIQSMFSLCSVYVQSMFSVKSFALILTFYYCAVLLISVEAGGERAPELQGREAEPRRPCRVGAGETHGGDGAAPRGVQKDQPGTRGMWGTGQGVHGSRAKGQHTSSHTSSHTRRECRRGNGR